MLVGFEHPRGGPNYGSADIWRRPGACAAAEGLRRAQAPEFAASIAGRRPALTDADSGVRVVTLLEAAERSLREEGRRIAL